MGEDGFDIWDTSWDEEPTSWGEVITFAAKKKKVNAACIDGVMYKGYTPDFEY